ncbi:NifU N-terminal domain-containing protein [Salinicoccus halitifaciens]|uniref:Scaffold protein Nfu/NifU N-terminal domain-containing protein n=1 Tax=Salinicoccus halitifaciens TaxID=1073415 RepID=A0ABV2E682_9STAP|nr:NifU N-terminal domain-containing protein [Salinicoccus halitifaciens]MCD2136995.1 NifU N-terminal domain-containing protein [Salinicoccus halitifaciens]
MEIVRIEPTPSPNTMKITVSEEKGDMKSATYRKVSDENPDFINKVLELEDVTSVFHAMDFISVDKSPKADWETLIPKIESTFNSGSDDSEVKKNQ